MNAQIKGILDVLRKITYHISILDSRIENIENKEFFSGARNDIGIFKHML